MLVPFLIMLREGVEATLIVGIVASYLRQTGRISAMRSVWIGVGLATALCLTVGVALDRMSAEFPQKIQEMFEAGIGLFAVVILTSMVFWMRRAAVTIKAQLHDRVDAAFAGGDGRGMALVAMAFFAVAREGLELVFFLLAVFQQDVGIEAPIGALLGLAVAILIGLLVYVGGVRLNLRRFFRWTGIFILFVAAGLLAGSVRSLHEAGLWNGLQTIAFDLSETLPRDGIAGTLLAGLLGYQDTPAIGELLAYVAFLVPALVLFLRAPAARPQSSGALRPAAAIIGLVQLLGFAGDGRAATAGEPVVVAITAKSCEPAQLTVPAGTVTFQIVNKSSRALEFEILKGVIVVDERENIAPGFKQKLTTKLDPGEYDITCGLIGNPHGKLTVVNADGGTGITASKPTETDLIGPAAEYRVWIVGESTALAERTQALAAAISGGKTEEARALWLDAHRRYLRLAPPASQFADLTARIDPDAASLATAGAAGGGFGRLAIGLFQAGSSEGLAPVAATLSRDIEELRTRLRAATPAPDRMVAGAVATARTIAAAIPGNGDLADAGARFQGIEKIVELLRPLTVRADPGASAKIDAGAETLRVALAEKPGNAPTAAAQQAAADFARDLAALPSVLGL